MPAYFESNRLENNCSIIGINFKSFMAQKWLCIASYYLIIIELAPDVTGHLNVWITSCNSYVYCCINS